MWITGLLGLIGQGVGGFFGLKGKQAEAIQQALDTIGQTQNADAEYTRASSEAIAALYENGPPVERLWRPCLMWVIIIMIVARWFGFVPPNVSQEEITVIYQWLEIGLIGYMPLRTVDKLIRTLSLGSILKTFINKKLA